MEVDRPQEEAGRVPVPGGLSQDKKMGQIKRFGSFQTLPGKNLAPLRSYSEEDVNSIAQGHTQLALWEAFSAGQAPPELSRGSLKELTPR